MVGGKRGGSSNKLEPRSKVIIHHSLTLPEKGCQTPGQSPGQTSLLDYCVTTARSRKLALGEKRSFWAERQKDDDGKTSRRIRRFYHRYFTGVGVGGRLRFLTLTSSDQAVVEGLDIHRSWRCLVMRLRRRWGAFEYIGVREIKGDRQHLHLVFRGSYIQQQLISAMWNDIHKSPIVFVEAMHKVRGGANELAKYLGKEVYNRYWASYNWVFRGWVSWTRAVKRYTQRYPTRSIIITLARMLPGRRREVMFALASWATCDIGA